MRASKLFLYILLGLIFAASIATPALAVGHGPDNPDPQKGERLTEKLAQADDAERDRIWGELSKKDKDAVVEYNTVVKIIAEELIEPSMSEGAITTANLATSGCDVRGRKEKGINIFGAVLWEYYSRVEWCFNGTNVTSKFATRTGKAGPFPSLWEYKGDAVPPVESGGVGKTSYRIWVNGYFKFAVAGYPIQTAYPWIDITVRGNGTSTASSGQ